MLSLIELLFIIFQVCIKLLKLQKQNKMGI